MGDEEIKRITRAIYALKSPPPAGSEHYRAGWDDALDAAIDAVRDIAPAEDAPAADVSTTGTELSKRVAKVVPDIDRDKRPKGTITAENIDTNEIRITWDHGGTTTEKYHHLGVTWVYAPDHSEDS
jgi:hypothetical protein